MGGVLVLKNTTDELFVGLSSAVAVIRFKKPAVLLDRARIANELADVAESDAYEVVNGLAYQSQVRFPEVELVRFMFSRKPKQFFLSGRDFLTIQQAITNYQTQGTIAFTAEEVKAEHLSNWFEPPF